MRRALAIVVAGLAIAGAVYLAHLNLNAHGYFACGRDVGSPYPISGICAPSTSHWVAERASWQKPVAILIAVLGVGAAIVVARSGSRTEPASGEPA